jgi:endonuclease-8
VPEGDTVLNHARALQAALGGQAITRSDFRVPRLATASLVGWTVAESTCRGKHLLLRFGTPAGRAMTLHSHLRMDGTWRTYRKGERWAGRPAHLIRAVLSTATADAVGYHLHELAIVPTDEESTLVGHLGPDLLGADWDQAEAVRRLGAAPEVEIADALLDQRNLAGIGNIYKSETLFLRGVSPFRPVAEITDLGAMVDLAHRLLRSNVGRWTQVTTGSTRPGEQHWVYGRRGRPCRRCGTPIRSTEQGPDDRVTFWCPSCQPSTAPAWRRGGS